MKFRPCIDIHDGKVKQIIGSSLNDCKEGVAENYVSKHNSQYFANLYKKDELLGGHIILLNSKESVFYQETLNQAVLALREYPQGLQVGGGINEENALYFLEQGASHVIVTSYVFEDGKINYTNLESLSKLVGKEKLVLDLSCRKKDDDYYIVTNRWQKFTDEVVNFDLLSKLSEYCSEFLIHAVDVEGKLSGIEMPLVELLAKWEGIPITYAGGISSFKDIELFKLYGKGKLDFTIGSALDIFGGNLIYKEVINYKL